MLFHTYLSFSFIINNHVPFFSPNFCKLYMWDSRLSIWIQVLAVVKFHGLEFDLKWENSSPSWQSEYDNWLVEQCRYLKVEEWRKEVFCNLQESNCSAWKLLRWMGWPTLILQAQEHFLTVEKLSVQRKIILS